MFFAASLRDHSIYLLKWKTAVVRVGQPTNTDSQQPVVEGVQPGEGMNGDCCVEYKSTSDLSDQPRPIADGVDPERKSLQDSDTSENEGTGSFDEETLS